MSRRIKVPTRLTDPATSREAAESVGEARLKTSQRVILRIVTQLGPLTDEEIYEEASKTMMISPSGARTRRKELVDRGLVRDSGFRGRTQAGRRSVRWEATRDPAE